MIINKGITEEEINKLKEVFEIKITVLYNQGEPTNLVYDISVDFIFKKPKEKL